MWETSAEVAVEASTSPSSSNSSSSASPPASNNGLIHHRSSEKCALTKNVLHFRVSSLCDSVFNRENRLAVLSITFVKGRILSVFAVYELDQVVRIFFAVWLNWLFCRFRSIFVNSWIADFVNFSQFYRFLSIFIS